MVCCCHGQLSSNRLHGNPVVPLTIFGKGLVVSIASRLLLFLDFSISEGTRKPYCQICNGLQSQEFAASGWSPQSHPQSPATTGRQNKNSLAEFISTNFCLQLGSVLRLSTGLQPHSKLLKAYSVGSLQTPGAPFTPIACSGFHC